MEYFIPLFLYSLKVERIVAGKSAGKKGGYPEQ